MIQSEGLKKRNKSSVSFQSAMGQHESRGYLPVAVEMKQQEGNKDSEEDSEDEMENSLIKEAHENEKSIWIFIQIFFPFVLAGLGMVGAGLVLDKVQHWDVFKNISELFILVPALLGLKGNLEMTLASRLSTLCHQGKMDSKNKAIKIIGGNLALIQCQGIIVGLIASLFAIFMGIVSSKENNSNVNEMYHGLLLAASSVVTASIASLILGLVMIAVILLSRRCNLNPDNIATPIAAALGDLTTLGLLAWISQVLYDDLDKEKWLAPSIIGIYSLLIPIMAYVAYKEESTSKVLVNGWIPVILAMIISSIGGVILNIAVISFQGIAVYQPVMNGVGGNLVAVQASRLSTYLHTTSTLGTLPNGNHNKVCISPWSVFASSNIHGKTAQILLLMTVPGHLIFTYTIALVQGGHTTPTLMFLTGYLTAACIQVLILLITAHWMIYKMWKIGIDPDNSSIPYLTALGDLLGNSLLAITFYLLYQVGDKDLDVGD